MSDRISPVRPIDSTEIINEEIDPDEEKFEDAPEVQGGGGESSRGADDEKPPEDAQQGESPTEPEASEAQASRGYRAPETPTPAQREEHNRTHLPYRGWCD